MRIRFLMIALAALIGVGAIKLLVALSAGRSNVEFLIVLMILAVVLAIKVRGSYRTAAGESYLGSIRSMFSELQRRASEIRPGSGSRELLWLTALFGAAALPASAFPFVQRLWPQPARSTTTSGCGGASYSSGCGGGGGGRRMRRLRKLMHEDRVGLGWRPELAAGIFDALDRIDVLEVIADNYFAAGRRQRRALKALSRQVPVHIHSIALGLAGAEEVATRRLDRVARLVNEVEPESWSEHLAFVRAGGIEIGHLAAPPRTEHSVATAARNLGKARAIIGSLPQMENIATLIEPPCSTLSEQAWMTAIAGASGCGLLLDLHNLYANATQFFLRSAAVPRRNSARARRNGPYRRRQMDRRAGWRADAICSTITCTRDAAGVRPAVGAGGAGAAAP